MTRGTAPQADPEWFRRYYGDDYMDSVRQLLGGERSEREADFLLRVTGLRQGARVADLGCGEGRHALALAGKGLRVTAVDLSPSFLERGRAEALRRGLQVDWVLGDMRTPCPGPYDLVALLFETFGYFSDEENLGLLQAWRKELGPGGRLIIDVWNRERILADFVPQAEWTASSVLAVQEERRWDGETGRLFVRYRYRRREGPVREYDASFRLYGREEVAALLGQARFALDDVFGDLQGAPWRPDSPRLVALAAGNCGGLRGLSSLLETSSNPT